MFLISKSFLFRSLTSFLFTLTLPSFAYAQSITTQNPLISDQIKLMRGLYPEMQATDKELRAFFSQENTQALSDLQSCASQSPFFAGLDVRYEPNLSVSVKFTKDAQTELLKCSSNQTIAARPARFTLNELERKQSNIGQLLHGKISIGSFEVSIPANKVIITTTRDNFHSVQNILDENGIPRDSYCIKTDEVMGFSHTPGENESKF